MMLDPRAKFYYPDELRRFCIRAFIAGVVVGAGVIAFFVWIA